MNIVLDTNVIISATLWEYSVAQKLVTKLLSTPAKMFTTTGILQEYQKVLYRDFGFSVDEILWVADCILPIFRIIEIREKVNVVHEDPSDNKIIECALAFSADYIITYDRHLLDIRKFRGMRIN